MNYSELSLAIQNTTENKEASFVASIPAFVVQAEQRIFNTVHLLDLRRNVTSALTVGTPYLKTPSDFLAVYSLAVKDSETGYHFLINKDVNFIREAYSDPQSRGLPRHYALFDEKTFILGPTPDIAYQMELHQFYYPESIVTANTTWLGDHFEGVLLYACLVQAAIYMKEETDVIAMYDGQYKEQMALLKRLGDGMERQDTYRSGQVVLPVT